MRQEGQEANTPGAAQPQVEADGVGGAGGAGDRPSQSCPAQVEAGEAGGAGGRPSRSRGRRFALASTPVRVRRQDSPYGGVNRGRGQVPGGLAAARCWPSGAPHTDPGGGGHPRAGGRVSQVRRGRPASPAALPQRFGPPPHPAPAGPCRRWQTKLLRWGAWNRTDAGTSMRPGMRRRHWSRPPDGGWGAALRPGGQAL